MCVEGNKFFKMFLSVLSISVFKVYKSVHDLE
jgi:hypothetical protein